MLFRSKLFFNPCLLRKEEFLTENKFFNYVDVNGKSTDIHVPARSLCFTYCQIPILYKMSSSNFVQILFNSGELMKLDRLEIDKDISEMVFKRTNEINQIIVHIKESMLK